MKTVEVKVTGDVPAIMTGGEGAAKGHLFVMASYYEWITHLLFWVPIIVILLLIFRLLFRILWRLGSKEYWDRKSEKVK